MKFLETKTGIIHIADVALVPICAQTNADGLQPWQSVMGPATCKRCLTLKATIDAANAPSPVAPAATPNPQPSIRNPQSKSSALDKIRKLLQRNGRTEAEADTAQIIAAALAEKHGISQAEIEQAEHSENTQVTHRQLAEWGKIPCEADYAAQICKRFFEVLPLTRCGWTERLNFIGTEHHITLAEYVFHFLVKEFRWQWNKRRGRCRDRKAFIFGCYCALAAKLRERFPAATTPGLEVSWSAKREKYMKDTFGETTSSPIDPKKQGVAVQRGYVAGQDIEIRPGVNAGKTTNRPELTAGAQNRLLTQGANV